MADEDKEKAEKLAAAKKRFEELKKKQAKGNKKKGSKKDNAAEEGTQNNAEHEKDVQEDGKTDDKAVGVGKTDDKTVEDAGDAKHASETTDGHGTAESEGKLASDKQDEISLSIRSSKQRSESFKHGLKSPALPIDASSEVQEIYRKQATRIEELEARNQSLSKNEEENRIKLQKLEGELDTLKEGNSELAGLKSKADLADNRASEIEKLTSELASTRRQLTQAQQAAAKPRRISAVSPSNDFKEQLNSKTAAVESLELEMSNLRNQLAIAESEKSSAQATIESLEKRVALLEQTCASSTDELDTLKKSMGEPADKADESEDALALQRKITLLESDLRTAQTGAETASKRATALESKVETLTKLSRESAATTASRDKEIGDLKTRLAKFQSSRREAAGEDLEDLENEERERLHARIRDLEAETFELRRGVWRDRRTAMQPAMEGDEAREYEDVDLNEARRSSNNQHSTFQDVLQSGINAFTGKPAQNRRQSGHNRKESLGLLSDDDDFDVGAYRLAQQEEGKRRIERMKETKRGLEKWRGWRMDIVDLRSGGLGSAVHVGPIFEV